MTRQELASFLRDRREALRPADVGLPAGSRRRTPGLRREEVAGLAHMSVEYYTRLEQARGPRPSAPVLDGVHPVRPTRARFSSRHPRSRERGLLLRSCWIWLRSNAVPGDAGRPHARAWVNSPIASRYACTSRGA